MKKQSSIVILLVLMLALTGCATQKIEENEQSGTTTETRIVSTSVAICEILDALGVEEVVGVPETASQLPSRYEGVTQIGAPMSPDLELVSSVDATVILSPISLQGDLQSKYDAAKLESYFVDLNSVEGMYASIETLGTMFGKQEEAKKLVKEYETYLASLKEDLKGIENKKVLILMGLPGSYVVATEHSYVGSLVKLLGATNVYEDHSTEEFINVNTEDMLQKNPDIILRTSHALPEQVKQMFEEEFKENDIWKHFEAVKAGKVYDLSNEHFGMSANLKYQDAIKELIPYLQ